MWLLETISRARRRISPAHWDTSWVREEGERRRWVLYIEVWE